MLVGSHGRILDSEEVRDFPCNCWECYEAWDERWWEAVYYEVPDEVFFWDNIAWPDKYVTDLDARKRRLSHKCDYKNLEGFHIAPKHLYYWREPGLIYKHLRGESNRRQRVKKASKHSFRTRTRAALRGNCKSLRKFFPASRWDIY